MRTLMLILVGASILCPTGASGASAGDFRVARAFGNTIVSTYPDGRTAELWLKADGSYTAQGRRGDRSSGRWAVKGDKLCLKQARPFPAPFSYCTSIPPAGMSKPWRAKAVTGERISVRLVEGRYVGKPRPSATEG